MPGAGEIPLVRDIDAVLADICPWKCSQTSIRLLPRTSTPYRKHKGGTATKQYCAETPHQGTPYPPTPLHQISRTACRMEGRTGMPDAPACRRWSLALGWSLGPAARCSVPRSLWSLVVVGLALRALPPPPWPPWLPVASCVSRGPPVAPCGLLWLPGAPPGPAAFRVFPRSPGASRGPSAVPVRPRGLLWRPWPPAAGSPPRWSAVGLALLPSVVLRVPGLTLRLARCF